MWYNLTYVEVLNMSLSKLLFKYDSNQIFKSFIAKAIDEPELYVSIESIEKGYIITPTTLFMSTMNCSKTSVSIGNNYKIKETNCGCLLHHKTGECMHVAALFVVAMYIIDRSYYHQEYKEYLTRKTNTWHASILSSLSQGLKTTNPYFQAIHLIPCIDIIDGKFNLSLKIGYDKDYVIKDLLEFIKFTEENIEYSYGQKLTFVHSYECFDSVSKELYAFLRNIVTDNTTKSIVIRRSQMLKILELYKGEMIFFKNEDETKSILRKIEPECTCSLILNDESLSIESPYHSKLLICGINHAYFIDNDNIYAYMFTTRMQAKLFEYLYKVSGKLFIGISSSSFIKDVLPLIKAIIKIDNSFYDKYPIPNIKINSYFSYNEGNIYVTPKIACREPDKNSPYLRELLDGYLKTIENFNFIKTKSKQYVIESLEEQYKFLTSDLTAIKSFGNVFFDETMKSVKPRKTNKTRINVSYNVGLLDFKFENNELSLEDIQAMLTAYHQKKKFVKLKDNSILELDNKELKKIDNFLEDFNISIKELANSVKKPLNYLLKLVNGTDSNISMDNEVIKMIQTIQNYKKSKFVPQSPFDTYLREYQMDAFKWLSTLSSYNFGGILADDMGLGKTLEIISFIASDSAQRPSLIVCPMSLVYNWQIECEKWNIGIQVVPILGSIEERETIIQNIDQNEKVLYITSYDSLRRDVILYKNKFRFVIADEAQFIKNQFAQKSEAIKAIQSEINFALTGTPIENGLADLWSIFDFLMPGYLSNYSHFKSRYESLVANDDTDSLYDLQKRVSPFILRRTKKDVLKDLPDKIEEYYYCKMDSKQRDIYDGYVEMLKEDLKAGGNNILALLTRLRQICITPELIYQENFDNTKINMAIDLIKSSIEAGHRILVFSQFSQSFPILSRQLEQMEIKHFILDGSTKAKNRLEMVDEFNKNLDNKVFLISLKAGGTGLNLVGADMVIHLDPWWNSSAENQATDRAYRIGQTKNVHVVKLVCKDTIEEKVLTLQNIKKDLAESIITSDTTKTKLSKNDILELLE